MRAVDSTQLARAREQAGFTQNDVAALLGVARPMVSYWETGTRKPNDRQLRNMANLYGLTIPGLLDGSSEVNDENHAEMLFRRAQGVELSGTVKQGLTAFVEFLDTYAELLRTTQIELRPMRQSPFALVPGFDSADDARRKAEEVRAHLRLGLGPIVDVDDLCDLLGITVYRVSLGPDVTTSAISGAFYKHPDIGFSIVVNLEMTPGRRRFTLAHELCHALLHSSTDPAVVSGPKKDSRERFADAFASEFLMPTEGIRRAIEEMGIGRRIEDPAHVIHLQRFFNVSYVTALVRLRQAKVITNDSFHAWEHIRPVRFAESLGYAVLPDERSQDVNRWGLNRYPGGFRRALRVALRNKILSIDTAAELTGVAATEIEALALDGEGENGEHAQELREFSSIR